MQFLLTKEEYEALTTERRARDAVETGKLQALCTLAAKHIPVPRPWAGRGADPWGCILDEEMDPGYCDDCPAQEVCPNEWKKWSE